MADKFKTLLLRNGGNDGQSTIFRDALMQSLVEHTSLDIQAYKPVIVFLNGEYWGIHNIRERFDRHYFEQYYGVSRDDLVLMEGDGELVEGTEEDVVYYRNMINYIKNNSMKDPKHYRHISTLIDIENFILYNVAQIFLTIQTGRAITIVFGGYGKKIMTKMPHTATMEDGAGFYMILILVLGCIHIMEAITTIPLSMQLRQAIMSGQTLIGLPLYLETFWKMKNLKISL